MATALLLATLSPRAASAAFDMSGKWVVFFQLFDRVEFWDVMQTGTAVIGTATCLPPGPCPYGFAGTINLDTGMVDIGITLTLAPDNRTFTGGFDLCLSPPLPGCNPMLGCCTVFIPVGGTRCANGVLDPGETCEDGNLNDGDGCDSNCTVTACGNGIVTAGEQCDDGNADDTDACKNDCTRNVCGDGTVRSGVEECDDHNLIDGDGCDSNCTVTRCGNGVVSSGEQCDDGNVVDGDGCDHDCTPTGCGNGIVTGLEQCDDGNTTDGDGCSSGCQRELIPGGGSAATDCVQEWVTSPVSFSFSRFPSRRVVCIDDQAACDFGAATGDRTCTFLVGMCLNVVDSALSCAAGDVRTVRFLRPRAGARDALASANRSALEGALAGIGGIIQGVCANLHSGVGTTCTADADCDSAPGRNDGVCRRLVSFGAGLTPRNVCTALTPIRVPAGRGRFGKTILRLNAQATRPGAPNRRMRDVDELTLICRPAL